MHEVRDPAASGSVRGPAAALFLTEPARGLADLALALASPWLVAAPRGDGHGVLVLPGFMATDTSTGLLFKSGTDRITGGTGRFAGATGHSQFQGTQWTLYTDADGNAFSAQETTAAGTIVLPGDR